MKQNKAPRPIELLREEKARLKQECTIGEDKLAAHWQYFNENMGSLLLLSAASSVKRRLGFGSSKKEKSQIDVDAFSTSSGGNTMQRVMNGLLAAFPVLWEVAQPMLLNMAMDKFKSLFRRKKKEPEYYADDERPKQVVRKKKKSRWKK